MNHLDEYIACLNEDPTLLDALSKDPVGTVSQARLSNEEKRALLRGDMAQIQALIGDGHVPIKVREVLEALASRPGSSL